MNDFFNTLGIEATKEEKEIKKAYREKLHIVNPEDDPNGFKILREAYEEALKYARQKEDEKEKRLSPVEDFIFRCEQLYKDVYKRQSLKRVNLQESSLSVISPILIWMYMTI